MNPSAIATPMGDALEALEVVTATSASRGVMSGPTPGRLATLGGANYGVRGEPPYLCTAASSLASDDHAIRCMDRSGGAKTICRHGART